MAPAEYTGQLRQCTYCFNSGHDPSPRTPMVAQQALTMEGEAMSMSAPGELFHPACAVSQHLRRRAIALLLNEECEVNEGLVVCWIQIERLAVIARGVRRVAGSVSYQAQEIKRFGRRTML